MRCAIAARTASSAVFRLGALLSGAAQDDLRLFGPSRIPAGQPGESGHYLGVRVLAPNRAKCPVTPGAFSLVFLLALLLPGCALHRKQPRPATAPAAPRVVGTVAVVNDGSRFVLLDVGSIYAPASGVTLKCYDGEAETGELVVSPEKKRPFIAADVVKGEPRVGNRVEE